MDHSLEGYICIVTIRVIRQPGKKGLPTKRRHFMNDPTGCSYNNQILDPSLIEWTIEIVHLSPKRQARIPVFNSYSCQYRLLIIQIFISVKSFPFKCDPYDYRVVRSFYFNCHSFKTILPRYHAMNRFCLIEIVKG